MKNFDEELMAKKTMLISENIKLLYESVRLMDAKKYEDLAGLQLQITANTTEIMNIDNKLKQQQ